MTLSQTQSSPLLDHLNFKIAQISSEEWAGGPSPQLRLSEDAGAENAESLRGRVDVVLRTRSGETVLASIDLAPLRSQNDIDDAFADTLSKVLMNHQKWPR